MQQRFRVALFGLFVVSAAQAADTTGCSVHKGLYDSWLSLAKQIPNRPAKGAALAATASPSAPAPSASDIANEYRNFLSCLSEAALPADDDGGHSLCKDAVTDRIAAVVCQAALYLKTGRSTSRELLDAIPGTKKGAELIWDLQNIAESGGEQGRYPELFLPDGPGYKIVDELFVLVLDDRDTAAARYFQIVGNATGAAGKHVDAQIKVLARESPAIVVKQWMFLRQHQAKLKRLMAELATELPAADLMKLRKGIRGFCTSDNLDCPEILKLFGRAE